MFLASLFGLPFVLSAQISLGDTLRLSLEEAVQIALEESSTIKVADGAIQKARYAEKQGWAKLFPDVNFSGTYGHTLKKQKMYIDFGPMGGNDGIEVGQRHNIQAGVQAGMPLVNPQLWTSLLINKDQVALAKEKSRESRLSLIGEVKKAYLTALLSREAAAVYQRSYDQAKESYEQIKLKYEKGLVAEFDLIRQNVQVTNLLPNLLNAQQSIALAEAQLKVLMDLPMEVPIQLGGALADFEGEVYQSYLSSKKDVRGESDSLLLASNSSLRQLELQTKLAEKALKVKKLAYLPTLSLGFSYQYSFASDELKLNNSKRWAPYSMISLSLTIPLFSSGNRYFEVKQSQEDLENLRLSRISAMNQLKMGLLNAESQIENAAERYAAAKEAVKSAEKGYQIAKVRYAAGESTLLELNDAEIAVLQARLNNNQAIYDYMQALYSYETLRGVDTSGYMTKEDKKK